MVRFFRHTVEKYKFTVRVPDYILHSGVRYLREYRKRPTQLAKWRFRAGCISLGAIDCGQTYVVLNDTRHCKDKMAHTHMINGRWYLTSSEHVDELLQAMG